MKLRPEQKTMLSIFTGPGGTEVGLNRADYYATDAIELDRHACRTLRLNFPHMRVHESDIRLIMASQLSCRNHLIGVYTWPCDKYTNIAAIHAAQTGDDLYLQALRFQALLPPEIIFIENVLGMMEKFPVVMELWRNLAGYYCTEFTVYGHTVTQMRKARLFMILHRQPFTFPSVEEYLATHTLDFPAILAAPGRKLGDYLQHPSEMDKACREDVEVHPYIETRLNDGYARPAKVFSPDMQDPIPLAANSCRDRSNYIVIDPITGQKRPLSHRELARLHGFPDSHVFCGGKNARNRQVVDSVMPPVAYIFGKFFDMYFDAIDELMPQPKALGHRMVSIPGETLPTTPARPEPLPSGLSQQLLFV